MFVERNHCTVCHAGDLVELYRRPYAQDPVAKFLANYYRLEERCLAGGWEARFAGSDFVLQGCNTCRAVTQRLAPDTILPLRYMITGSAATRNTLQRREAGATLPRG